MAMLCYLHPIHDPPHHHATASLHHYTVYFCNLCYTRLPHHLDIPATDTDGLVPVTMGGCTIVTRALTPGYYSLAFRLRPTDNSILHTLTLDQITCAGGGCIFNLTVRAQHLPVHHIFFFKLQLVVAELHAQSRAIKACEYVLAEK